MEFRVMKRKQLQALCKKHGVPANLTNLEMGDRLSSILKEKINKPEAREQSAVSNPVVFQNKMDAKEGPCNAKKVRFSPNNETFLFVSSNVKTSIKPKRTTRSRLAKKASVKQIHSPIRSTRSRAQNLAKKVVVMDVSPMLATKTMRLTNSRDVAESAGNNLGRSDGAVDVVDRQNQLKNRVPKKRADEEPFNRIKSAQNTAGHLVTLYETDNSSIVHQRDRGRRPRKKLEPRKKKDEGLDALDKKPEEIKIGGRVTRTRSRMILETSLAVSAIFEVESQGEAGLVQQQEVPSNAVPVNLKKPRTMRKNLQKETLVSSNCQGADTGQGTSNRIKSDKEGHNSSILSMESVISQRVKPTVDPGNKAPLRRSKRKPQLSAVLANKNSPADAVDRMNSPQKQEDSLHVKVARDKLTKSSTMDITPSYEESSRTSGSHTLNAVQLYPAQLNSETIGMKQENVSGALISEHVSSIVSPSKAKSSLFDGFDHVKKLKMKNHVENSEENLDREKSEGAGTLIKGDYVNQKTHELPSHVAVASEELSSFSEDCERDFQANLHNQSSPPQETAGSSCACISLFDKGFGAERVFVKKHDCSRGIMELDHQDDRNGNRVSERGTLTPADKLDNCTPKGEEPAYSCKATQLQVRNLALQTEDSRISGEDIPLKTACPMLNEALCSEQDGDDLPSEKYNQVNIAEATDKHSTNQDAVQAVGPLMAVLHMDAINECLRDLSPRRHSVAPKQCVSPSSWQQDGHPQESDYASHQMPTDTRNKFVGDVTSAAEGKSTPRLTESKSSYNQEALYENKEGSGSRSLDLHLHQGEIDVGSSLTPQTVPDACSNQGSIISAKMSDSDPSSFGISRLFDYMVRVDNAEACGDDHLEKVSEVADAHRNSMSPIEAGVDRQKHLGTKYEDDVYRSDGLSGGHCGDALKVNDVRPYSDIEPCGDYHPEEVAADANIETFSQAETSTWKKYEQGNMEEFSAHTHSSSSIMVTTGQNILRHCSNQKKLNSSGQEDMKKRKHDQIELEAYLDGLGQELLSIEGARDHISQVQTAVSGSLHSNIEKSSCKEQKSVKLPEQDNHECIGNTPPSSVEGSYDADKASEILGIGEYNLRTVTPEHDAIISKDELTITSPNAPKSSKVKSFTGQVIKDISKHVVENLEQSVFSKRITSSLENYAESAFQIDQKASFPAMESQAKLLTSPATLLEDIQRSICLGVEVAAVEDVRWLERALLEDTYDCSVKCGESSTSATLHEVTQEAHGTSAQENAEIMTIQNVLSFAADSQHGMNASHVMDEKTEKPSNAQTHPELALEENKGFAAEDLYPLFGGEEPICDQTVQNLSSNTGQKMEEETVELKISEFPKNENEIGVEKTDFIYVLDQSENQLLLPCVEQKSDDAKEAHEENGSHMLADEVQASDSMVESRSPHTCASRSPVLSLENSANHYCIKFSDVQVQDPTFSIKTIPLLGDSPVLHNASNMPTDDQNIIFKSENVKEESMQQINHQEAPGAEEIAETTDDTVDVVSWERNFKDSESAEEFKDIDFVESIAEKNALADALHAENIKQLMDDQEAASAMIQEYMDRKEEEDETTTIKSSIGRSNDDVIFLYSEADYLPAGVLFSENRDFVAVDAVQGTTRTEQLHVLSANSKQREPFSKKARMTDITETPMRTAPRASDMKENTGGIKTVRTPTTASKTRTMRRRALEVLPNK